MSAPTQLTVALAQLAPVWLDREKTLHKVLTTMAEAADHGAALVVFSETLVPGYPFWLERTGGAVFNSPKQKQLQALYLEQAVNIESGHLAPVCALAAERNLAVVLGTAERASDRGGHSVYCSLVYIDQQGVIQNVHRKLMPTYEERLAWSPGDGHGLRTFALGPFTLGALNCWENWMPLPRAALYAQGEDLHVSIWPGGDHNTHDLPRFLAKEGRSYVIACSGLMRPQDIPAHVPHRDEIIANSGEYLANGGSCLVDPSGAWVIEPQVGEEGLHLATIDHRRVYEERHNFDPAGHYSRPDVTRLEVDRTRQSTARFHD